MPLAPSKMCTTFLALALAAGTARAEVTLLATGSIPGNAKDQSGLDNLLEDGVTPHNQVGGLGSAIAYTGRGNRYIATPDRGPADGTTRYVDRAYILDIDVKKRLGQWTVTPRLVDTRFLRSESGRLYTGSAKSFDATNSTDSARLDPEGIRFANCGRNFYLSDEYGPFLYEFRGNGRRERAIHLPNKFLIDSPSDVVSPVALELLQNVAGRQLNRGMEGLAISPNGHKLYGIMQSPLIQDGGLGGASGTTRVGTNSRIVEVDVKTGEVREFLYQLEARQHGVSEIVAVNDHEFLVLERDGNAGLAAAFKRLFLIDITGATDIRDLKQLPSVGTPIDVTPVTKTPFLDFLDPAFGLGGKDTTPEKWEGLAFGPDLADGRHLLIVSVDNDFFPARPNLFYAFAIDPSNLVYEPQAFGDCYCHPDDGPES